MKDNIRLLYLISRKFDISMFYWIDVTNFGITFQGYYNLELEKDIVELFKYKCKNRNYKNVLTIEYKNITINLLRKDHE